jgi:hypothetical protein
VTPELITAILGVGGLGLIVPKIIDGLQAWRSGRADEEKATNQSLFKRMLAAESRAEREAIFRRMIEEYAAQLRVLLVQLGHPPDRLPPWPVRPAESSHRQKDSSL